MQLRNALYSIYSDEAVQDFFQDDGDLLRHLYDTEQTQWIEPVLMAMPFDAMEYWVAGDFMHFPGELWAEVARSIVKRGDTTVTMALALYLLLGEYRYQEARPEILQLPEVQSHLVEADRIQIAINQGQFEFLPTINKYTPWWKFNKFLKAFIDSDFQKSGRGLDPHVIIQTVGEMLNEGDPHIDNGIIVLKESDHQENNQGFLPSLLAKFGSRLKR